MSPKHTYCRRPPPDWFPAVVSSLNGQVSPIETFCCSINSPGITFSVMTAAVDSGFDSYQPPESDSASVSVQLKTLSSMTA